MCVGTVLASQLISWPPVCVLWVPWMYSHRSKKEWSTSETHTAEYWNNLSERAVTSKVKPKCICNSHNTYPYGVDYTDQYLLSYHLQKTRKKFQKGLFFHLLQCALFHQREKKLHREWDHSSVKADTIISVYYRCTISFSVSKRTSRGKQILLCSVWSSSASLRCGTTSSSLKFSYFSFPKFAKYNVLLQTVQNPTHGFEVPAFIHSQVLHAWQWLC